MEEEIAKLVFDYSINARVGNKDFAQKVISIVVNKLRLNDQVRSVIWNCKDIDDDLAAYSDKVLGINMDNIMDDFNSKYKSFVSDAISFCLGYNLWMVLTILHELEHANQLKMLEEKMPGIESQLILLANLCYVYKDDSLGLGIGGIVDRIRNKFVYEKYYYMAIDERLAEIKALFSVNNIIELLGKTSIDYHGLSKFNFIMDRKCYHVLKYGYKLLGRVSNSPTYIYICKLGYGEKLKQLDIYDKDYVRSFEKARGSYSLLDRVIFGLPISRGEYNLLFGSRDKVYRGKLVKARK